MARVSPTTHVARLRSDVTTAQRIMDAAVDRFDAAGTAAALVQEEDSRWIVELTFARRPDTARLRALVAEVAGEDAARHLAFSTIRPRDWVEASLAALEPVVAGRFTIHGRHDRARVAPNRIAVEIEAALAFGTGHHATTRGCLIALDALVKRRRKPNVCHPGRLAQRADPGPKYPGIRAQGAAGVHGSRLSRLEALGQDDNRKGRSRSGAITLPAEARSSMRRQSILDLGTGSGVLAIAAAKALRAPVLGSDLDPAAVTTARDNIRRNHVAALVEVVHAVGLRGPRIRARAPYDLVFANLLLGSLKRLAAPTARILAPGARVILSGLLTGEANAAIATYSAHGLALERRIGGDGWMTLVMMRPAP